MKRRQVAGLVILGTLLNVGVVSAQQGSDTGLDPYTKYLATMTNKMADKDGMVSKKDFMAMMEKRFDMMDKNKTGKLHKSHVMATFSDKP